MSELFCPACRDVLRPAEAAPPAAKCAQCGKIYPVIHGVPVLVENAGRYLSDVYRGYREYCEQAAAQIQACDRAAEERPERRAVIERYQAALRTHSGIMESLMADVAPHLDSREPSESDAAAIAYSSNLNYARRDWCGEAICETELADILQTVRGLLAESSVTPRHTLVLGAGAGRTAWDLCEWLPEVTAVDLSYTMPAIFNRILEGPVDLYAVNRSNTLRTDDLVQHGIARLPDPAVQSERLERFRFWVADARRLPLPDRSVDAVLSIYFTDVLPLDRLLREIKRVLKSDGVFVHYGPLDYHFEDFAASLAAEEVRERLTRHRFRIVSEKTVESAHLATSGQMVRHIFQNWAFLAINQNREPRPLRDADVLSVAEGVRHAPASLILVDGTKLECGPGVASLLEFIDGSRTVREVVESMSQKAAAQEILATLQALLDYRVLELKDQ